MKIAIVMLGNNRHKSNDYGYWSMYAALRNTEHDVELLRLNINKNEHKYFINKALNYQIVFLSIYYDNLSLANEIIENLKLINSSITIAIGGSIYVYQGYPCLYDQDMIQNDMSAVDFVITGDPQLACVHIVEYLMNKRDLLDIANVIYFGKGEKIYGKQSNFDIEKYNNVAIIQAEYYHDRLDKRVFTMGSIGCSSNCSFCFNPILFGKKLHLRTENSIVNELAECAKSGHNNFTFIDSSFDEPNHNSDRLNKLATLILEKKLDIYFSSNITCTAHVHSERTLEYIHKAGLCCIFLGCETFNVYDLSILQKRHTISDCLKTYWKFKTAGIDVLIGLISYNPYSTLSGLLENDKYYEEFNLSGSFPYVRKLRVFPGTQIHEKMIKDGLNYINYCNYELQDPQIAEIDIVLGAFCDPVSVKNLEGINYFYRRFIELNAFKNLYLHRKEDGKRIEQLKTIRDERDRLCNEYGRIYSNWFRTLINDVKMEKPIHPKEHVRDMNAIFEKQIAELNLVKEDLEQLYYED